jgi:phage tail-like protein
MRPEGPTSWLLDGHIGWRTAWEDGVSVGDSAGIGLAAAPGGPLSLQSAAGDLGGLALPQGIALDRDHRLYILSQRRPWRIRQFDPGTGKFAILPTLGEDGAEVRQFHNPSTIACAGRNLYVADTGNQRVQVFDLFSLALRHLWMYEDWEPVDITVQAGIAYILDRRQGRVWGHRPGTDALSGRIHNPAQAGCWSRVIVDCQGHIMLLNQAGAQVSLEIYDAQGKYINTVQDAGDVRDRFETPLVGCHYQGGLYPSRKLREAWCPPLSLQDFYFNRQGEQVEVTSSWGPRRYQTEGIWISEPLDSDIYHCQWHRLELALPPLPAGTQLIVSTYTDDQGDQKGQALPEHLWEPCATITGQMQPPPDVVSQDRREDHPADYLIQSREGQYLWLRLQFKSDGYATPSVHAIRVHYPRSSYLAYLPAVFAADDESRRFLERFLSIFQAEWDDLERKIAEISRYFDPRTVPAGDALRYLAQWLALPLEGAWNDEQLRNLLKAAPELYAMRGTAKGLRGYLQVYIQNMTELSSKEQRGYPIIIEGFRERYWLFLSQEQRAVLNYGAPLWGPAKVGRLQLDVFAREGDVRLVSTGDPARDIFHEYAHRFRVFIPEAWVRTAEDEAMVRRALDAEKPAHTQYDLCLVAPRFRVGVQSTIGLDTIIGAYPVARLACAQETGTDDQKDAPSLAPHHCLGYDTVLGGTGERQGVYLAPSTRVGVDTILI